MNRDDLARIIVNQLNSNKNILEEQYNQSKNKIGYFYIDNLLPKEIVYEINN